MREWFRRHFKKGYKPLKTKKEEEEEAEAEPQVSLLPEYEPDKWNKGHVGYRMQKLAAMVQTKIIIAVAVVLLFMTISGLFLAFYNSTYTYDAATKMIYRVPDPASITLAALSAALMFLWLTGSASIIQLYRRAINRFYDNSRVLEPTLSNYLGESWIPANGMRLYNGGEWAEEPNGSALLVERNTHYVAKLAELEKKLGTIDSPADPRNPVPVVVGGKTLEAAEVEGYKVILKAEIQKYKTVTKNLTAYMDGKTTIWSNEARDHKYIWKNGVLIGEVGWKIYVAVPGPSVYQCTPWIEVLQHLGFKDKKLYTAAFSATVDLPAYEEVTDDPDSDHSVIVQNPMWGMMNTPNQGLHHVWTAGEGILTSTVLDIPKSTSLNAELEQANNTIAILNQRLLKFEREGIVILLPDLLQRMGISGNLSDLAPVTQTTTPQPLAPQTQGEVKSNNGSKNSGSLLRRALSRLH